MLLLEALRLSSDPALMSKLDRALQVRWMNARLGHHCKELSVRPSAVSMHTSLGMPVLLLSRFGDRCWIASISVHSQESSITAYVTGHQTGFNKSLAGDNDPKASNLHKDPEAPLICLGIKPCICMAVPASPQQDSLLHNF
jgi:hypothetical protein